MAWLQRRPRWVLLVAVVGIGVVFALDATIPGFPVAGLFLLPLALAALGLRARLTAALAAGSLALALAVMIAQGHLGEADIALLLFLALGAVGLVVLGYLLRELERVRQRALVRAQLAEAETEIVALSSSRGDLDGLLQSTVERIGEQMGAESALLLLLREGEWVGIAGYGYGDARQVRFPFASLWPAAEALRSDRALVIPDALRDERMPRDELGSLDLRSVLVLPLRAFGLEVGVIVLNRAAGRPGYTVDEVRFAESMAGHAAIAIDNARLIAELDGKRRDLALVVESSLDFAQSRLDLTKVLEALVMRLVNSLGVTECGIYALEPGPEAGQQTVRALVSYGARDEVGFTETLYPLDLYSGSAWAVRTGQPLIVCDANDSRLSEIERNVLRDHGHGCQFSFPLIVWDEVIGLVELFDRRPGRSLTNEETDLATAICQFAAFAIYNARLYETERTIAETFRRALLDKEVRVEGVDVGVGYLSREKSERIGGDFYDVMALERDRVMVAIGDVCGRGLRTATQGAMAAYMLRAYVAESSPGESLSRLNAALVAQQGEMPFITLLVGYIDTRRHTFEYAVAGHPRPLVFAGREPFPVPGEGGVPVGIMPHEVYPTNRAVLPADATIVLFTDGAIEARGDGDMLGEARLAEWSRGLLGQPAVGLARELRRRVYQFSERNLRDDVCLVVVRLP